MIRGVSYPKVDAKKQLSKGYYPVLRGGNIQDEIIFKDLVFVPSKYIKDEQYIRRFDVVLAMSSGSRNIVGKAAQAKEDYKGSFGAFCGLLRPNKQIEPRFFGYYFKTKDYRTKISNLSAGVNINNLRQGYIENLSISLPPLPEQKRIVTKIENLYDRLNKTKQELAKILPILKKFRQSVLAKAFSGELTKEWRGHQTDLELASKLLERIREERKKTLGKKYKEPEPIDTSDLPELPEMWEWTRMDDCCLVNPRHPSDILPLDTQISFIPMPAISAEVGAITKPEIRPLKKVIKGFTHFAEGDVLFAKITPCMENGKAAIAKNLVSGVGCGTTELYVLRPLGGILSEYIYYYIRQQSFRDRAEANMTGTAGQLRVPVEFIRNEILPIPSAKEQKVIINKIKNLYAQADTIEKSVKIAQAHCEKLTQSILAKAFRGELVEQDPNDEPAEKLLSKIERKSQN
jgi:type I restriction enzyme S subunit